MQISESVHSAVGSGQRPEARQFFFAELSVGAGRRTVFDLCGGGRVTQSSNTV